MGRSNSESCAARTLDLKGEGLYKALRPGADVSSQKETSLSLYSLQMRVEFSDMLWMPQNSHAWPHIH